MFLFLSRHIFIDQSDGDHPPVFSSNEQSFFLQVKNYMRVDLHMVGCRQFAGGRRLA